MTGATINYDGALGSGGQIRLNVPSATEALVTSPNPLRIVAGVTALDGSNPTPVATGFTVLTGASATIQGTAAPGDNTSVITYDFAAGTINFYGWKNTGGTDPTLVASTGTETFSYIAMGF